MVSPCWLTGVCSCICCSVSQNRFSLQPLVSLILVFTSLTLNGKARNRPLPLFYLSNPQKSKCRPNPFCQEERPLQGSCSSRVSIPLWPAGISTSNWLHEGQLRRLDAVRWSHERGWESWKEAPMFLPLIPLSSLKKWAAFLEGPGWCPLKSGVDRLQVAPPPPPPPSDILLS